MKKLLFLSFFLITADLFPQCYTPDTTKIPLSGYTNSYAYFTGADSGCFLRTGYSKELALDYSTLDTFCIEWRMKIRHLTKTMNIFGYYDSVDNKGWFISYESHYPNSRTDFIYFYSENNGYKYVASLGSSDSNWHNYMVSFSKSLHRLICTMDGTIKSVYTDMQGWNIPDSNYTFVVGYSYAKNYWGDLSLVPISDYYFNGYIDNLKITYLTTAPATTIFNWSFNDGAGQYIRDSSDYKTYEVSMPTWGITPGHPLGKHLQNGLLGVQDKCDIVWFNEGTGSCPFDNLGNGVRSWENNVLNPTQVLGIGEWNGNLVAIGDFNRVNWSSISADDGDVVNHVATWNPNNNPQWSNLGNGLNLDGRDAISYDGDLIVTGEFSMAGGNKANCIAGWNGNNWYALGKGLTKAQGTSVPWGYVLKVWDNDLYVSGNFLNADDMTCNRIARWDGSDWHSLNEGLAPNNVWDMEVYNGNLYAGGSFNHAVYENIYERAIMKWDGSEWSAIGRGIGADDQGGVMALCVFNGELYAGGQFTTMDSIPCNGLAKYNDSSDEWSSVGDGVWGLGSIINDMVVYNDELYITGSFYYMDGLPVNKICKYDGSNFCAISNGLNERGVKLLVYNDELIIAGSFFSADGADFNNILRYNPTGGDDNKNSFVPIAQSTVQNYPNPFNPKTTIKYKVLSKELVSVKIYDIIGREVLTLVNEVKEPGTYSVLFDGSNYASGIYFYQLKIGNDIQTKKMVLVK